MVDIKGAVQKPGVYQLPKDARVKDALAQAGGATKSGLKTAQFSYQATR